MALELQPGDPLAESLQSILQPKLVEMGWSTDGLDDSALAEYIVLMLVNGKTQEQISSELANDLLGLGPEDVSAINFARWLFQQLQALAEPVVQNTESTTSERTVQSQGPRSGRSTLVARVSQPDEGEVMDETMDDTSGSTHENSIPTGPKSMRDTSKGVGNKRLLGQVNRALARTSDSALHKIKGTATAGRINTHAREPPKGPTPKGPRNLVNSVNRVIPMQQPRLSQTPNLNAMMQGNPFAALTPQQQMQLLSMYEEQARMMAQILTPQQQHSQPTMQPLRLSQHSQQPGKSLFERVDLGHKPTTFGKVPQWTGVSSMKDSTMSTSVSHAATIEPEPLMEVEPGSQNSPRTEPALTMCYFNLGCTKADCHFVHQSPAAPSGITVDMTDTCTFGAACKNRKCVGKHPSPAKAGPGRAQENCKFYPNCTNLNCPFKHPSIPPCRNGADCTVSDCKFAHSKIQCRFDPCLNPVCPFKHHDGQRRGVFHDKVWISTEEGEARKDHVSERRFVADAAGEEDLILPGQGHTIPDEVQAIT